jgi:hypothetical protein
MPNARLAQAADLVSLLALYRVAEVSASAEPLARAERIWSEMLSAAPSSVHVRISPRLHSAPPIL